MTLLSTTQAADILGVKQARVRQLILAGRLPARKIGRDWVIRQKDLELVMVRPVGRPPKKHTEKARPAAP
jgi:excisionase family DNA binding protein